MLNRTRYRLVALFSLVFFVIINGLGAILYYSTEQRLYAQTDRTIERELHGFTFMMNRQPTRREFMPRPTSLMTYLHWDNEGKLAFQAPRDGVDEKLAEALRGAGVVEQFVNVKVDDAAYRVLTRSTPSGTLQVAYDLQPERNVLDNLMFIFATGSLASIVLAVLTGLFLANRAFIPIQKAWDQQQQFVSDASHELRTPLSVLQLNLERLFRHPDRTIVEESEKIAIMIDETRRMSRMVGDLLTLARSDANRTQLSLSKVQLPSILSKACRPFAELAQLKGVRLEQQVQGAITITGDADYLHQLFVIILDNALKFTAEGTIRIEARSEGLHAVVVISDTGIGMKKEELPHIFDRFYRADQARGRGEGGTGLGLAIAKWIAESHGGTIRAESTEGAGTSVELRFPLA
ncbi:cell wall metabolism sensor histidine kinase WalK [Paenibacillus sp. YYML68]|uniref:sensor histidine kinase n=1 Tax=Paenibacillus sp. YYML68 TaxID=2909250 RepID=UPI002490BFAC|nr:HAMP domain-containing sensor histidine kinase [Paenibacillus sp. YYML68]